MSDQAVEIRDLRERVDQLERMLVGTYSLLIAVVLVLGLVLPFVTENTGEDEEFAWSVLSFVLSPQLAEQSETFSGFEIAVLIGFIVLIVVAVMIMAGTLIPAAAGVMTDGLRVMGLVLAILGIIGSIAVLVIAVQGLRLPDSAFGAGAPVLLVGMIGVLPLVGRSARPIVSSRR